jgi:hypothetical protein
MNKKQATASLAIVGMALLATITMISPTQALASASLDDEVYEGCLEELGGPGYHIGRWVQVQACLFIGS